MTVQTSFGLKSKNDRWPFCFKIFGVSITKVSIALYNLKGTHNKTHKKKLSVSFSFLHNLKKPAVGNNGGSCAKIIFSFSFSFLHVWLIFCFDFARDLRTESGLRFRLQGKQRLSNFLAWPSRCALNWDFPGLLVNIKMVKTFMFRQVSCHRQKWATKLFGSEIDTYLKC